MLLDVFYSFLCFWLVLGDGGIFVDFVDVEEVMWDFVLFFVWYFCCVDVYVVIQLYGICIDDFCGVFLGVQLFGEVDCEIVFVGVGGVDYGLEGWFCGYMFMCSVGRFREMVCGVLLLFVVGIVYDLDWLWFQVLLLWV